MFGHVGLPYPNRAATSPEKCLLSATAMCWSYLLLVSLEEESLGGFMSFCLVADRYTYIYTYYMFCVRHGLDSKSGPDTRGKLGRYTERGNMTTLTFLRLWCTYIGATLRNSRMIWMMAIQNGGMSSNMRQHEGNTESCDTATTDASLLVFDKFVAVLHRWLGLQQILFGFVLWAPHPIMNRIICFTHSMTMRVVNPNLAFGDGWCNPEKWLVGGFNPSEKY